MNSLHWLLGQLLIVAVVIWAIRQEKAARKTIEQPSNGGDSSGKNIRAATPGARDRLRRRIEERELPQDPESDSESHLAASGSD